MTISSLLLAAADDVSLTEWAQVVAAAFAVVAAVAVPLTAYRRRPSLELTEQEADRHSRVEGRAGAHLRLFVRNKRRKRAAQATRVLVEAYRPQSDPLGWVSLSHPSLGWPSATDAAAGAVTLYAGSGRPIGLGVFIRGIRGQDGRLIRTHGGKLPTYPNSPDAPPWFLVLSLHELDILDDRDKLSSGEWVIRLLVGANDGDARRYDVHVAWSGDAADDAAVLDEALERLHVDRVKRV